MKNRIFKINFRFSNIFLFLMIIFIFSSCKNKSTLRNIKPDIVGSFQSQNIDYLEIPQIFFENDGSFIFRLSNKAICNGNYEKIDEKNYLLSYDNENISPDIITIEREKDINSYSFYFFENPLSKIEAIKYIKLSNYPMSFDGNFEGK